MYKFNFKIKDQIFCMFTVAKNVFFRSEKQFEHAEGFIENMVLIDIHFFK